MFVNTFWLRLNFHFLLKMCCLAFLMSKGGNSVYLAKTFRILQKRNESRNE